MHNGGTLLLSTCAQDGKNARLGAVHALESPLID